MKSTSKTRTLIVLFMAAAALAAALVSRRFLHAAPSSEWKAPALRDQGSGTRDQGPGTSRPGRSLAIPNDPTSQRPFFSTIALPTILFNHALPTVQPDPIAGRLSTLERMQIDQELDACELTAQREADEEYPANGSAERAFNNADLCAALTRKYQKVVACRCHLSEEERSQLLQERLETGL